MKYNIKPYEKYSIASITKANSKIVTAYISVDIHNERGLGDQVAELAYTDALLSGAGKLSRDQFLNAVNLLGSSINLSLVEGVFSVEIKSTAENFNRTLKLLETMLLKPLFSSQDLKRIKQTLVNELHQAKEDSKNMSHQELRNMLYGQNDRRYSYSLENLSSAVSSLDARSIKNLHSRVFNQSWTCSIIGDKTMVQNFEKQVSTLTRQSTLVDYEGVHQQKFSSPATHFKNIPGRSNIDINIGASLPITLHHPDFAALSFAIAVLGKWSGFAGRLMSTVRDLEGLTYGIYGKPDGFTQFEQGYWRIMTFFSPDKAVQGITSTLREVSTLYNKGITGEELSKFKTIVHTQQALLHDSSSSLLAELHSFHNQGFSLTEMKEYKEQTSKLTLAEVNTAIKTYLNPATLSISCAGPVTKVKKEIQAIIKNNSK